MTNLFPTDVEEKATKLIQSYADAGLRIVTAESCTGGLIAACLTEVSGASRVVDRGFVTYSNAAKTETIGVPSELIEIHGAVSEEVADAMALGALAKSSAHVALSVTGIAGPEGGSEKKPVGLVYLAIAQCKQEAHVKRFVFENQDRNGVRLSALRAALAMLESIFDDV